MTKILLVEDSKTYNNTIFNLLRRPDYQIFQTYTLKEAKEVLDENNNIDYIILDLILPDGEGDELIMEITSSYSNPPKIIILSGSNDIQRRNYLFENGVIDYFSKTTPIRTLISGIHKVINSLNENKNKNILVIDDSTFVLKSIENILKSKNYNIFLAKDPYLGIDILEKEKYIDLIFLDLEMPRMNGIQFLQKIKKIDRYKDIPVLVLSGNNDRESYSTVLKYGAIDFLKKPFLVEEILLKADLHISHSSYLRKISTQAKELAEYKRVLSESDIVSKTNSKGIITEVNDKFCEVSGFSQEYLIGKTHQVVRHPDTPKSLFEEMWGNIKNKSTFKGIIKNRRRDGTSYYVDATISPIIDIEGNIQEIIGIRHDITDIMNPKKQLIADISYIKEPTLIFLQIVNYDIFKEFYSETTMHAFEFELEQVILNYFPSKLELKKVYNLGNGLFGFLKNTYIECEYMNESLSTVLDTFKKLGISFKDNNYDIDISLSYSNSGNHILDDVHIGIQEAIKNKISIVHAKDFHRKAQIEARNKLKNIGMIKNALNDSGEFVSFFQPIVNTRNMKIEKYESLIRLVNKKAEVISPYFFLELAKKTGYYSDITELVIKNAQKALENTEKHICINLSSTDLENKTVRKKLLTLITKKQNKGRVTFEVLEDEDIKDFEIIKEFILECKIKGNVNIAIDDFGSGYSNYERLLDFQPDILKIDGSLIKNIITDSYSLHVVESIIVFAKKQNILTVAEFVSSKEILEKIKELGIDYAQGYYLGEPKRLF